MTNTSFAKFLHYDSADQALRFGDYCQKEQYEYLPYLQVLGFGAEDDVQEDKIATYKTNTAF